MSLTTEPRFSSSQDHVELVHVLLTGGHTVTVNYTDTYEQGLIDGDPETTGEVIGAIKQSIEDGNAVVNDAQGGYPLVIVPGTVCAYAYGVKR